MKSLSPSKPHLLLMVGLPASGKSFFAEKFADTFKAPLVSAQKITAVSQISTPSVTEALAYLQLDELLKTGQSIVLDGSGDSRIARSELTRKARNAGYELLIIWVQTDPTTTKDRAIRPSKNSSYAALETSEYERRAKRFTPPNPLEKPVVVSGKHTYATQVKTVLKRLSGPRAAISTHPSPPIRPKQAVRRNITIR